MLRRVLSTDLPCIPFIHGLSRGPTSKPWWNINRAPPMATFYRFIPGLLAHYRGPRGDKAPRAISAIPTTGWLLWGFYPTIILNAIRVHRSIFLVTFWYTQTYEIICYMEMSTSHEFHKLMANPSMIPFDFLDHNKLMWQAHNPNICIYYVIYMP